MDVSIIIVNYNTHELLKDAIDSVIQKTENLSYEIIVVDNNSTIKPSGYLKYDLQNIRYIDLDENIGFGRANNEGIKISKGRNILFLNPDTILLNNAIEILSNYLDNNDKVGACGGNLYDENLQPTHSHLLYFPGFYSEFNSLFINALNKILNKKNIDFNYTDKPLEVAYITGADLMIKKKVLDCVGYFDSCFFMYFEETELCLRLKNKYICIMNVPNAMIKHLEGRSFTFKEERERLWLSGRERFYQRRYSKLSCKILDFLYLIVLLQRILIYHVLKNKEKYFFWRSKLRAFLLSGKVRKIL